jgi:hypothetical protein
MAASEAAIDEIIKEATMFFEEADQEALKAASSDHLHRAKACVAAQSPFQHTPKSKNNSSMMI